MFLIIIYLISLLSIGKTLYINDFFSKKACKIPLEKIFQSNKKKKNKKVTTKKLIKRKNTKKKVIRKDKRILNQTKIKAYYFIDDKFKKKYKAAIVKYKNKYYLMVNGVLYKEEDFIEDYLIYEINLNSIILKKEKKYYIWIL